MNLALNSSKTRKELIVVFSVPFIAYIQKGAFPIFILLDVVDILKDFFNFKEQASKQFVKFVCYFVLKKFRTPLHIFC